MKHSLIAIALPLILYATLVIPLGRMGLSERDAHGVIQAIDASTWSDGDRSDGIGISRPPGHPLTENLIYPFLTRPAPDGNAAMSPTTYATWQSFWGAMVLLITAVICLRQGVPPLRISVALIGVLLGCDFLSQASDGEEFLVGTGLVLICWVGLIRAADTPRRTPWLILSATCLGLATGARLEYLGAGILPGVFFLFRDNRRLKDVLVYGLVLTIAGTLVWLPILLGPGLEPPFPTHMDLKAKLLGAVYKLSFRAYSPFIGLGLGTLTAIALFHRPTRNRLRGECDFAILSAGALIATYHLLFFRYPTKAAFLLVAAPALWLLLTRFLPLRLLTAVCFLFLLHALVQVDIFENRVLRWPHISQGHLLKTFSEKPARRIHQLAALTERFPALELNDLVITPFQPWDFAYARKHKGLTFDRRFVEKWAIKDTEALQILGTSGGRIFVDETTFRHFFHRYETTRTLRTNEVRNGIAFTLYQGASTEIR